MKIKTKKSDYRSVMARKSEKRKKPVKCSLFFRKIIRIVGKADLKAVSFSWTVTLWRKSERMSLCLFS